MGCDIHTYVEKKIYGVWTALYGESPYDKSELSLEGWIYCDRSYRLFTVLAGVRSYGEVIQPIAEPKGLPEDVTEVVKYEYDGDGHTSSWFTLTELLAFDWHQKHLSKAYTSEKNAELLKQTGEPPSSCRGSLYADMPVFVEWEEELISSEHTFITEALYKLQYLSDGKHDDIRLVFWFDN
jgi:hypothetical protein